MAQGRGTFFYYDNLVTEKKAKSAHKTSGSIKVTVEDLNLVIYVSSKDRVAPLQEQHNIPDANVISLIDKCNSSPEGIPESELTGRLGLNMFLERFGRAEPDEDSPILIHCRAGRNRSPVAAVIYLIWKGVEPNRAKELVEKAFKQQRDPEFRLDPFEHYKNVLQEAEQLKENFNPHTLTVRKPTKRHKIDRDQVKPTRLNFGL
jgi:protein tyrosine/serine phosphatase